MIKRVKEKHLFTSAIFFPIGIVCLLCVFSVSVCLTFNSTWLVLLIFVGYCCRSSFCLFRPPRTSSPQVRALVLVSNKIPASSLTIQETLLEVVRFTCGWYLDHRHAAAMALHNASHGNSNGLDAVAAALTAASSSGGPSDDSSSGGPATVAATVGNALVVRRSVNDSSVQSSHLLNRYSYMCAC